MTHKVLVVEDNPVIAQLWSGRLSREGYAVEIAEDGHSARSAVSRRQPDAVLLDLMLPDADGLSLCREWKSDPAARSMAVICVSAFSARKDREAALTAGADAYIAKSPAAGHQLVRELARRLAPVSARTVLVGG